jgi:endogenous inhibitor of DNA gyrase (YacG/DUF329 family)
MADREPLFVLATNGEDDMALVVLGETVCNLCGDKIENEDEAIAFPPFCQNENDICFQFSDGAFHSRCLDANPNGKIAISRASYWYQNVGPGKRKCDVCGAEVTDPNDYIFIPYMSDINGDPLMDFNCIHLHKSHIAQWDRKETFIELAFSAIKSGFWKGSDLDFLIKEIDS